PVEADVDVRDPINLLRPFGTECPCSAGRRHRANALRFEYKTVEFALADDDLLRLVEHVLPTIELGAGSRCCEHLGTRRLVVRVFCELEKRDLTIAVEDGNRNPPLVPAEEVEVDKDVGYAASV